MSKVTTQQLEQLKPYLEGAKADDRGEMEMFCPVHPDTRRSASINLEMGVWYCHAGCGGGSIRQLCDASDAWVAVDGRAVLSAANGHQADDPEAEDRSEYVLKEAKEAHERLMEESGQRRRLFRLRGINRTTIEQHRIGFDGRYFKIPVFSPERRLWNVRTYDPSPRFGRRKIWGVRGMNRGRLYPAGVLDAAEDGDSVLFCEGEWDALLALQSGHLAVTTTSGAGKPWQPVWDVAFAGLKVFLAHDADELGQRGNEIVADALSGIAEVFVCTLPYPIERDHGKDITDYLIEEDDPQVAIDRLLESAKLYKKELAHV
jgi:hypothetical protein